MKITIMNKSRKLATSVVLLKSSSLEVIKKCANIFPQKTPKVNYTHTHTRVAFVV